MVEQSSTEGARTGLFNFRVSRKGEFEDNERASKRQRVGSSAAAGLKMTPDSTIDPSPVPVLRKPTARGIATSASTTSTRRSTRLQQGIVKPQMKVRQSRSQQRILRLKSYGVAPACLWGNPKGSTPLTILRTYDRLGLKLPIAPPQLALLRCGQRSHAGVRLRARRETGRWCACRPVHSRYGARVRNGAFANVPVRVQRDDRHTGKAAAATAAVAHRDDPHRERVL